MSIPHKAKELHDSILEWLPKVPDWPTIQRVMQLGNKLMLMYGHFDPKEGFVDDTDVEVR